MSVVQAPVRYWRARDTRRELLRRLHHAHERHVPAVAPAEHADVRRIHVGKRLQVVNARNLILDLHRPHALVERGLELHTAETAAAIVQREDHVAVLHEVLPEEPFIAPRIPTPRAPHALHTRPTVHINDDGISLARLADCAASAAGNRASARRAPSACRTPSTTCSDMKGA